MADYAIHDTTLIGISNVIRKKEGSSALIDPAEYAERVNLMGLLEEKTASGSIVTFSDGADDVPLESCEVALPASLDGYSSVDVVNTGKNLIPFAVDYPNFTHTQNGITISVLNNGKVKFNGTTTALTSFSFYQASVSTAPHIYVKNGTYTFSCNGSASIKMIVSGGSNNGFPYREITNDSYTGTVTDDTKPFNYVIFRIDSGVTLSDVEVEPMLEVGSTATTYEPYVTPTTQTASLGRTIYGGSIDVVKGDGTDENGNDFTFEPVEINSRLGSNTMWSDGDMSVTYRASGTQTPIQPTLISKTITANGTYMASDDDADGYDEVTVNVASPEPTVTPLNSPNAFLSQSGVSGTDVTRTVRTETAPSDGKYVFASDSTCRTNTGSGDGFIDIQKNGVSVVKQYMEANTTTSIAIPDIEVVTGDTVSIVVGFDNAHTSCNFQLYTGIAFVSEASTPSLLSMSPSEEVNENEEVEENEQNDIEG